MCTRAKQWVFKALQSDGVKSALVGIIMPLIVSVVSTSITQKYISPPNMPQMKQSITYNAGSLTYDSKPFETSFKSDPSPWIKLMITNKGGIDAKDFKTDCKFENGIVVHAVDRNYSLRAIENEVTEKSEDGGNIFIEKIGHFRANSFVEYKIFLNQFVNNLGDHTCEFSTPERDWTENTEKIKIDEKTENSLQSFMVGAAYADDTKTKVALRRSGVFLDGYDPVSMAYGTIRLLQEKNIITNDELNDVRRLAETDRSGATIGGVNILKFDETLINLLLRKKAIDKSQANGIIERAKNAGGVLIDGYNVIVLNIEILNTLFVNSRIQLSEGQAVIDDSRQPPFRAGISKVGDPLGPSADPIVINSPSQ